LSDPAPSAKLRLFAALELPPSHLDAAVSVIERLRPQLEGIRWTDPAKLHLTIKFMGSVPGDRLPDVIGICQKVAARHSPSTLVERGLGAFSSWRRARVLWVGYEDPEGAVGALARDLDGALGETGIARDERRLRLHLTLGRARTPVPLPDLEDDPPPALEPVMVDGFVLFRSHLGRSGSTYEAIERIPLG
jgi:2'-5' RNA ligase